MNFDLDLHPIFVREKIIKLCRAYLDEKKYHEVISPILNTAIPSEATLYPFVTQWQANEKEHELFLSISPESSLKKMMAAGVGSCYSIGKCFRNLESSGKYHNPEFLMLEWYQEDADMYVIMDEVKKLFTYLSQVFDQKNSEVPWQVISLDDLCEKHLGKRINQLEDFKNLEKLAKEKKYTTENSTWEQLFDQLFLNEIEIHLPKTPFFLIDFPSQISPLCKPKENHKELAQRFEFFLDGIEIGNGNTEQTDWKKVEESFIQVGKKRTSLNQASSPIDLDFISALQNLDSRKYAGVGVGIDRLSMYFAGKSDINDVEPFILKR
ncbi:elongation factor P--(R)-beta-lysine ligase [soil metagenome]